MMAQMTARESVSSQKSSSTERLKFKNLLAAVERHSGCQVGLDVLAGFHEGFLGAHDLGEVLPLDALALSETVDSDDKRHLSARYMHGEAQHAWCILLNGVEVLLGRLAGVH